MKIFETKNIKLYLSDAIERLKSFKDKSCDLAICDPPYGASTKSLWNYDSSKKLNGFGGNWKLSNHNWDLLSADENFNFTLIWLKELKRIVKPTGSIWIHSTYHNSGFANVACQLLGLEIINEIVWYKRNAFPNLSQKRLTASHETILWVHTGNGKREYTFNYSEVKKARFEGDYLKEADKQLRTVWDIPNNKAKDELSFGKHPTQKPLRVAERILLISGKKDGTLIVPFAGSGTELIAGAKFGMNCIGFEINEEYYNLSVNRINHYFEDKIKSIF